KKCVTQKLVNHGTPDKPNWCVEYSPFLPNDMPLRTACPSREGVRGFPVTSAVHERLLDGDSDCACSAARWTTPFPPCPRNRVAPGTSRRLSSTVATSREGLVERGGALFRRVGFIAANLIAFRRSKTVSKAVHAPPADGPCRKAGTVCVGVNLISADGTAGVSVAVSIRAYTLVADRACRSAVAVTVSADVLATDPACRVAVSISVRVHSAIAVYTCRITRSIRVKDGALGVQRRNGYRQHQHCKDGACHRTPLLLLACRDQSGGKGRSPV